MARLQTWEASDNKWIDNSYAWTEADLKEISTIESISVSPISGITDDEQTPYKLDSYGSNFKSESTSTGTEGGDSTDTDSGSSPQSDKTLQENSEYAIENSVYSFATGAYEVAKGIVDKVIQYFIETGTNIAKDWNEGWAAGVAGRDSLFGEGVDGFFGAINNVLAGEIDR
jgi:hypothetical protein